MAVECLLEADAYFQYENEHYRERVTVGPWGNNIAIPPEYSVERFEEDMEGFSKERPSGLHGLPEGVVMKGGTYSEAELQMLEEVCSKFDDHDERTSIEKWKVQCRIWSELYSRDALLAR